MADSEVTKESIRIACIPALNAENTIASVVLGCQKYVDRVVVCDDGSTDMTGLIAARLGAIVLTHERNMGKGEALRSLFAEAKKEHADAMVTLDSDGQHSPDDIPKVLDALSEADVVVGSRFLRGGREVPSHRRVVNRVLNVMTLDGISDTQSGFRGYGKRAIETIVPSEMGMGVDSEILIQAMRSKLLTVEVPVSVKYEGKTSTHNPAFHTLDVLGSLVKLSSMRHPLMFYGLPGVVLIAAGIYYALLTLLRVSSSQVVTPLILSYGIISISLILIGLLAFFTGVILFTLTTMIRQRSST
ncbi:MAG: glycosyltransferase family 2 protein [Thaumarchaeota archaeon]|nr:glycosyltransferase family 2 protein [Nitrososphaerota archaeon]